MAQVLLIKKLFSCEFWKIIKNNYFEEHLQTAASSQFKGTINPYYCLLKNANFSVKKSNDEITSHIIK